MIGNCHWGARATCHLARLNIADDDHSRYKSCRMTAIVVRLQNFLIFGEKVSNYLPLFVYHVRDVITDFFLCSSLFDDIKKPLLNSDAFMDRRKAPDNS